MLEDDIIYCPRCGAPVIEAFRFSKTRKVCPQCDWTHFADPKVAVAVLIEQDGNLLLVRRANDPLRGWWTLPAGFVDAGEDPIQAGERECLEETGLQVRIHSLFDVIAGQEHSRGAHILIVYRATVVGGVLTPGDDADQVGFFDLNQLPPLAFRSTQTIVKSIIRGD
jgi:8-oxo-dGTP diphosphatase